MTEHLPELTSAAAPADAGIRAGLGVVCAVDGPRLPVREVSVGPDWTPPAPAEGQDLLAFLRAHVTETDILAAIASAVEAGTPGMVSVWFSAGGEGQRLRWLPLPGGEVAVHIAPPAPSFHIPEPADTGAPAGAAPDQMVWGGRLVGGRVILEFVTGGFPDILRSRWSPLRLMDEWVAAIHPDDRQAALARFGEVRADSPPRTDEYRVIAPDGAVRWVRSTIAPYSGVYPDLGVWAIVTDITEERATRQELEHVLAMVRDLVVEVVWDASGVWYVRSLSPSAAGLLGVEPAGPAELGAELERRLHPDDMPLLDGAMRRLRAGASRERIQVRLVTRAGGTVRLEGTLVSTRVAGESPRVLGLLTDVTGRRAVEARLRRIAEVVDAVICESEMLPDGRWAYSYVSPSGARLVGAPLPADPVERAAVFMGAVHVDDAEAMSGAATRVWNEGGSVITEYRHVRADGAIRRVSATMARFIGDDGRPRLAGVKTDLTEQWEARAFAQRVLASVGAIVVEARSLPDGRWAVERASPELERLLDRPVPADPEAAGAVVTGAIHPDDRDEVAATAARVTAEGGMLTLEHRFVRPGGDVRWVRATLARAEGGDPGRRSLILTDITDQRSAGDRLRRVLDTREEVVVECEVGDDERWHATYASAPLDRLLATALPDDPRSRGRAFEDAVHPADRETLARELLALARRGGGGSVTVRIVRADGEIRWIRATMARRDAPPGRPAVAGVVADVTELLQTGQALLRAERGLNRLVSGSSAIAYEARIGGSGRWVLSHIGPNAGPVLGVPMPEDPAERMAVWCAHIPDERERGALLDALRSVREDGGTASVVVGVRGSRGALRLRIGAARIAADVVGGVITDVTEVMDADDALRAAQARLMRVIAAMGEAVYEVRVTKEGEPRVTYGSPQLWRLYGLDGAPPGGEPTSVVHPDDRDLVRTRMMRTLEGVPLSLDYRVLWPDGQIRWIRATGRPRLQPDGSVLVAGTMSDVTDERIVAPAPRPRGEGPSARLTGRQMAVLDLLAEGAGTDEIAVRLEITRTTVANHVAAILRRLGARSRLEAVHIARREGLIGDD
ncbi:MAG: PAS domain-containing protein [Thermoleophilia bacterium]|nr:PAS domain-containing protein [Thermoleophilia bacterium]